MTDPQPAEATVTIASQSIELALTGKPDVKNKWGAGSIRPRFVVFTYLPEGIRAHLYGVWVREDGELTDAPVAQDYRIGDTDEWPDWMAELAREHKPADEAPAADRSALRDRIAAAIYEHMHPGSYWSDTSMPADWRPSYLEEADAVLSVLPAPADRAGVLREAAGRVLEENRRCTVVGLCQPCLTRTAVSDELRRMADEAQQPEAQPAGWHLTPQTLDLFVRALVNEVDYDIHKGYECGEEDGEDHYPELVAEAAEMLDAITNEQPAAAQQPEEDA